jgi:DNA ligase-1
MMMGMTVNKIQEAFDRRDEAFTGTMAADWIRDLESSDSRLHKEAVIEKALIAAKLGSTSAQCFLFNAYAAYNPFHTYNVKKVDETHGLVDRANPWPRFWALLESLRTRSTTGNDARGAIQDISKEFDSEQWNAVCRRVLIKDLRCGISEKTLNKVLVNTAWEIPVFSCQLAKDSADRDQDMQGIKRLEVKLDGVRVLAVITGNGITLYSRNGKVFDNFLEIEDELRENARHIREATGTAVVLDGEIVGDSFQKLMRQTHRKTGAQTEGMRYHIFDWMPLADFERGYWNRQQDRRLASLSRLANRFQENTQCLAIMPGMDVDLDTKEGQDTMRRFAQDAVAEGYEGIMIKDLGAPYECKRSSFWMKWKPTITVDLNIVGFEEGTGRNKGRLGALVCEGVDNDRLIRVNVGSGLRDSDRVGYWSDRNDLLGRVVEVEADAVTQNQDGSYSLRFPRFVRFRGFEPGEKL